MTMIEWAVSLCVSAIQTVIAWFTATLNATSAGEFYIAMIFIVMACGFLLSNFGSIRAAGSDLASEAARPISRNLQQRRNFRKAKRQL